MLPPRFDHAEEGQLMSAVHDRAILLEFCTHDLPLSATLRKHRLVPTCIDLVKCLARDVSEALQTSS